jgi:hypothetical protein
VGGSNDDIIRFYCKDDATLGASQAAIRLCDNAGASDFVVEDSDTVEQFRITSNGSVRAWGSITLDDDYANSPALNFVGGSYDDSARIFLDDASGGAGNSDLVVDLCDAAGNSEFQIRDSGYNIMAKVNSDGEVKIKGALDLDKDSGDSPRLNFVGGTNDDTISIYLDEDATSGYSDLAVRLCDDGGESEFQVMGSGGGVKMSVDSDGMMRLAENQDIFPDSIGHTSYDQNSGVWTRLVNKFTLQGIDYHFNESDTIPSGFSWASTPFGAVNSVVYNSGGHWMNVQPDTGGGGRHFLYESITTYLSQNAWIGFCLGHSAACGLRIDDGTDDNYCEALWHDDGYVNQFEERNRTSGGSVNTVQFYEQEPGAYLWLRMYVYNSTPDKIYWYIPIPVAGGYASVYSGYSFTWTASRAGIIIQENEGGYGRSYVDYYERSFT